MKYVPSALVGQLSKSAGSTTAGRNRFGSYFRNRSTPVNTSTAKRTLFRAQFGSWSNAWRSLTTVQRAAWNALATTITFPDSLGQMYNRSGLQMFMSANQNIYATGNSGIQDAPAWNPPTAPTSLVGAYDDSANTFTASYGATPVPADTAYVIEASAPVSAGISMLPRSRYKIISILPETDTSPANIHAEYIAIYGNAVAGQKIFMRISAVDILTGQRSAYLYAETIVVV